MGFDSPSHWAIIAVVVLLLFGYKRLPEMSRSLGRSLRIFKTEMKGLTDDDAARDVDAAVHSPAPVAPSATPPVAQQPAPVPANPQPAEATVLANVNGEHKANEQLGA